MYELSFTDEKYITPKQKQEMVDVEPENSYHFSGVPLENHFVECMPISSTIQKKIIQENDKPINEESKRYLKEIVDMYLEQHPEESLDNLEEKEKLGKCMELTYKIVKAGTGERDGSFNELDVRDQISLDRPPKTKCRVFNQLFKNVFSAVAEKIDPDLIEKHQFVDTPAVSSIDLAQGVYVPGDDKEKKILHAFLTLLSRTEQGYIYTPIDPYHVDDESRVLEDIDFSLHRMPDAIRKIVKAMAEDPFKFEHLTYVKSAFYSENLESLKTLEEKASLAIIITNEIYPTLRRAVKEAGRLKKEVVDKYKSWGKGLKMDKDGSVRKQFIDQYKGEVGSASEGEKKHRRLEVKMLDQVEGTLGELESAILNDKHNLMALTLLSEIADNCGRQAIPIKAEVWQKINDLLENELLANQEFGQFMKGEQSKNSSDVGLRYNKKPDYRLFRGRFLPYGDKAPLITQVTNEDKADMSNDNDKEYQRFRANLIAIAMNAGISQMKPYLPKEDYLEGTKAWYFKEYLAKSLLVK